MKVNAFLHTGKNIAPTWKDSTRWTSVLFFLALNELGSLMHTLYKSSQILSASPEAPVEAIRKVIFTVKADGLGSTPVTLASLAPCSTEPRYEIKIKLLQHPRLYKVRHCTRVTQTLKTGKG